MTANRKPSGLRSLLRKRVHLPPPDVSFVPQYELSVVAPETTLLPIPEPGILGLSGDLVSIDTTSTTVDIRMRKPSVQPLELASVSSPIRLFDLPLGFPDLATINVLTGLSPVTSEGRIFVKDQSAASQPALDRITALRAERPPTTAKPKTRDIFELLLPILMPPAQTEFGKEFLLPEELYDFQRYGVKWLLEQEGALLADDMGLGKTVQAIIAFRVLIRQGQALQALVVCPKSILTNWSRELERWAPELMVAPISGTRDVRRIKWQSLIGKSHVILATYEAVREDSDTIRGRMFDLVVLDEIQRIKNPSAQVSQACRRLSAKRRWGLSGTPLENRVDDVAAIFRFLEPGLFSPTENLTDRNVKRKIEPYMLRRRKEEALKDLPSKVKDTKYLSLLPRQRDAYDQAEISGKIELQAGGNVTIQHVLALITKLKQICNFEPTSGESAKLEFLEDYLEDVESEQSKALVFSQFVQSLEWVNERLSDYKPLLYTGKITSTKGRDEVVQRFRDDPESRALLLSLKAGGVGLNLPWANYVVHFDSWWNPAVSAQAEDRAHRIGQEKTVFVTTLVSEDTIEERIEDLLAKKRQLFSSVIDDLSDAGLTKVLSEEELFGLFGLKPSRAAPAREPQPPPREHAGRVFKGDSPFSNVIILRSILEECTDYIWWADMHFRRRALVELREAVDGGRIRHIRILSGDAVVRDDARSKDDFKRFRQEVTQLGIDAEWRIAAGRFAHDRYIIGSKVCFNVPPVGTIFAGDYGEALETANFPPFEVWWNAAVPIEQFQP